MAAHRNNTPAGVTATGLPTTTRRTAMLAALTGLGAVFSLPRLAEAAEAIDLAVAAQAAHDHLPAIYAEKVRVCDLVNECESDAEADVFMDAWGACERRAIAAPATTPAGAAASIEWARAELLQFWFDADRPDNGTSIVLALLDGAQAVLRDIAKIGGVA